MLQYPYRTMFCLYVISNSGNCSKTSVTGWEAMISYTDIITVMTVDFAVWVVANERTPVEVLVNF